VFFSGWFLRAPWDPYDSYGLVENCSSIWKVITFEDTLPETNISNMAPENGGFQ